MNGSDPSPPSPQYRFGRCVWQPARRRLLVDGQPVAAGSRALDLLHALIERRDRVVLKDELLDVVWPEVVVEEANLHVHVSALRKLLGPGVIATIAGRGYRFVGDLGPETDDDGAPVTRPASRPTTAPTTALIGRRDERAALLAALATPGLVTLAGTSGIGKTRLAADVVPEAAATASAAFAWVDFAAIAHAHEVPRAFAQALRIAAAADATLETIVAGLGAGPLLVVLDNAEHVVDGAAALAAALAPGSAPRPALRLLVTSQMTLAVPGERVVRLGPLPVPPSGASDPLAHDAVRLFVERAREADHAFTVDARDAETIADICRRLDGVPLAIEFAAARVRALGAVALRDALDQRLHLLGRAVRGAPARHRTLRAALAWSIELLAPREQTVLRRLSVFPAGCTLELAQAVAGDAALDAWAVLDALAVLVDRSLVVVEPGEVLRYRLLDSVRLYAAEALEAAGETHALRDRHADAMTALCRDVEERSTGEHGDGRPMALGAEIDGIRQALQRLLARESPADAIALAGRSARLWYERGLLPELLAVMWQLEPQLNAAPPLERVVFLTALGNLGVFYAARRGDLLAIKQRAVDMARADGLRVRLSRALVSLASGLLAAHRFDEVDAALVELSALERPDDPALVVAGRLSIAAMRHIVKHEVPEAIATLQRQRAILLGVPDQAGARATADLNLVMLLNASGRHAEALDLAASDWADARVPRTLLGFVYQAMLALAATERADAALALGRRERERLVAGPAIAKIGAEAIGTLALARGRLADALRVDGALEAHRRGDDEAHPLDRWWRDRLAAAADAAGLDATARAGWRAEGARLNNAGLLALVLDP